MNALIKPEAPANVKCVILVLSILKGRNSTSQLISTKLKEI